MSLTDDALKAKFSTLNETQDSIVSVSNWIMFHKRHADRVAQAWYARLRDSGASKRLNLVYLANEVVQQSRARRKDDFPNAFSPIMADATQIAYKGAVTDVQQKIRRVVEVWRQRGVFEPPIMDAIEGRLDEIDKARGSGAKKPLMGSSLFASTPGSLPKELEPLASLQTALSKAQLSFTTVSGSANSEYEKLNDPNVKLPPPPVHAARLSSLLKALSNAENSVNDSIKARQALIEALQKLIETNKADLFKEETLEFELNSRKTATESKKREVEDGIMRGMSTTDTSGPSNDDSTTPNGNETEGIERPEYEALTPPPLEAITPPPVAADPTPIQEDAEVSSLLATMSGNNPPPMQQQHSFTQASTLTRPQSSSSSGVNGGGISNLKKRKMSHAEDDYAALLGGGGEDAMEGLDDDVAELLRQESAKV